MLYKGKYLIGIYSLLSEGEQLLVLLDNAREFAKLMNISYNNASAILSKMFNHKADKFIYRGKIRTISFIRYIEDED